MKIVVILCWIFLSSCHRKPVITPPRVIDVRIAFGYKDTRPTRFVGDRYERLYLMQDLMKPCTQPKIIICGFIRDDHDGDSIRRSFEIDKSASAIVRIKITPSSVGPDDDFNRKNPYQIIQSLLSENNLVSGLDSASATFYVGHSRDGGGPDFFPPKLMVQNLVDFAWYRKNKPGMKNVLGAIRKSKCTERQTFGMMSCLSSKHFEKAIGDLTKRIHFVSTHKLIYYTEALDQTLLEVSKAINSQLVTTSSRTRAPKTLSF